MSESNLEMAERHVEQAERVVHEQRERIAELEREGHHTAMARALLETFEMTLKVARDDLDLFRGLGL